MTREITAGGTTHVCRPSKTCMCRPTADEPNESCPVHGWDDYPQKCATCGRFCKRTTEAKSCT